MKGFAILAFIAVALAVVAARPDKYTTKYDNVDLNEILKNKRLLKNYVNCIMERGNCSPDGAELKKVLPDAIETECEKCSEKQKDGSKTVLRFLIDNEPETYKELEAKYDPTGTYRKKYKDEAKKEGIDLDKVN